jgi:hypothetical protein
MSSQRPLTLLALGVLIVTIAQGCTFPGANLLQPAPKNYGVLKLDPLVDNPDYKGKFGAVNDIVGNDGTTSVGTLNGLTISQINQYQKESVFVFSKTGGLYNTNNGGRNWRQVGTTEGLNSLSMDYSKSGDTTQVLVSGSVNTTGKIYLSTNEKELKEVHSDVPGDTSIPFVSISPRSNSNFLAIVRNSVSDEIIVSVDAGSSWRKSEKLPSRVRSLTKSSNGVNLLLENNQLRRQNNSNDGEPTFDIIDVASNFANQTILKTVDTSVGQFLLTNAGLYRVNSDSTTKFSLPVTDSPVLDFAIDPYNTEHYIAGVGTRLLETTNSGSTWTVRSDVGNEAGAGKIYVTHFDPFVTGQIYLGRGQ